MSVANQKIVDWLKTPEALRAHVESLPDFRILKPDTDGAWIMICDALKIIKLYPVAYYKFPQHIKSNSYGIALGGGSILTAEDWINRFFLWVELAPWLDRASVLRFLGGL